MRILILTQWYDPEPTFKGSIFAKELVRLGHDVEVLTGFPNYPGGRVYYGYRMALYRREVIEGIPVLRVPLYPSHDGSALKRTANYLSFAISAAVLGACLVKPADVMYVYHPPATVGFAACAISLIRRLPFVYDIQDLWPDTLAATGMVGSRGLLRAVDRGCRSIYRRSSKIIVLSPGFRDALVSRGVCSEKIEVIYNWCDEKSIQNHREMGRNSESSGFSHTFSVVFAGTMGKAQALDSVLDAAQLIGPRRPTVQFLFVGGGIDVDRLAKKSSDMGLTNTRFLPRMTVRDVGALLSLADVLLVHLRKDPLFTITVPSKTQAYMAAGRPILMAMQGDAANLVEQAMAGLVCRPENPQEIAETVERFFRMSEEERDCMGRNGRLFYEERLSLAVGAEKVASVLTAAFEEH